MRTKLILTSLIAGAAFFTAGVGVQAANSLKEPSQSRSVSQERREITDREAKMLHDAEQILIRQCMSKRGFQYSVIAKDPVPGTRYFPYVIDDVAWTRVHGYGTAIEARLREIETGHPNQRHVASLPPATRQAWLAAINGERAEGLEARLPTGGIIRGSDSSCAADAERRLYGDLRTWYRVKRVVTSLGDMRRSQVTADRRFTKATSHWASCMRRRGFGYDSPAAVRAHLLKPGKQTPNARLIKTAVAEAECAGRSGLAATSRELDRQYRHLINQKHSEDTTAKSRLELAALPKAKDVTNY